jgi:hypothetical protein
MLLSVIFAPVLKDKVIPSRTRPVLTITGRLLVMIVLVIVFSLIKVCGRQYACGYRPGKPVAFVKSLFGSQRLLTLDIIMVEDGCPVRKATVMKLTPWIGGIDMAPE